MVKDYVNSLRNKYRFVLLLFNVPVNSYGHVGTVASNFIQGFYMKR